MALAMAAWRDFELNNAALSFSVILVGRNEQDGYLKDRASETPEDIRVRKHYEGLTLFEKLCKEMRRGYALDCRGRETGSV